MAWIEARIKRPLSSFIVTYYTGNEYIEKEFPQGTDCIAEAPTVTKSGWTFVGWNEDASTNVLSSLIVDHGGIYLYAVYKQTVTITLLGGDSIISNTGDRYSVGDHYVDPSIELSTASKSGWTLIGYRADTMLNPDVIQYWAGDTYEFDSNTTLHGIFEQIITLTYSVDSDNQWTTSGSRFCNDVDIINPLFRLDYADKSEWSLVGYRTDSAPNPNNIPYFANSDYEFENNTILYAVFEQEVQLIVTAAGVENIIPDYKYYNNGNIKKAIPTFADPRLDDADFKGYSTSDTSTTIAITSLANGIELEQTTYYYAVWKWHDGVIYDGPEIAHGDYIFHSDDQPPIIYDMYTFDATKYESVVVSMTAELHPGGSHQQNPGWVDLVDQDMVATCREYYPTHIPGDPSIEEKFWWWHPLYATTGEFGTDEFGPCKNRATGTIICNCPNTNPYTLQGSLGGWIVHEERTLWSGLGITKIVGTGRTIVY